MTALARLWHHARTRRAAVERAFPSATLAAIERAIVDSERSHAAEIRFVLEATLPWSELRSGLTPRARAERLFAELGVWDTAGNSGVLIYVLYAERAIEIVADRGFRSVAVNRWREICAAAEEAFAAGRFEAGSVTLVARVGALASELFPPDADAGDELPNAPLVL